MTSLNRVHRIHRLPTRRSIVFRTLSLIAMLAFVITGGLPMSLRMHSGGAHAESPVRVDMAMAEHHGTQATPADDSVVEPMHSGLMQNPDAAPVPGECCCAMSCSECCAPSGTRGPTSPEGLTRGSFEIEFGSTQPKTHLTARDPFTIPYPNPPPGIRS